MGTAFGPRSPACLVLHDNVWCKIQDPSKYFFQFSLGGNVWIKEVEVADSTILNHRAHFKVMIISRIFRCCWMREMAAALNKIIQNSYYKKKVYLEEQKAQKEDRILRGRQIAYMIYDYFRITGGHYTVLDYADLSTITFRNYDVQDFDTRWDEILLLMTKIPQTVESL